MPMVVVVRFRVYLQGGPRWFPASQLAGSMARQPTGLFDLYDKHKVGHPQQGPWDLGFLVPVLILLPTCCLLLLAVAAARLGSFILPIVTLSHPLHPPLPYPRLGWPMNWVRCAWSTHWTSWTCPLPSLVVPTSPICPPSPPPYVH